MPKPPKRGTTASSHPAAPSEAVGVRIGFSADAKAVFDKLPAKVRDGLRRKLRDFGANQAIGKPLVGALQGYYRVTYGRIRAVAEVLARVAGGIVVVHVLHIGMRKEGSASDPYETAAIEALKRGDPEAIALLEALVQQALHEAQDAEPGTGTAEDRDGNDREAR
jgi:mRNA-degrading endonuclease RelE of RelBE toxin-antitoxin system